MINKINNRVNIEGKKWIPKTEVWNTGALSQRGGEGLEKETDAEPISL